MTTNDRRQTCDVTYVLSASTIFLRVVVGSSFPTENKSESHRDRRGVDDRGDRSTARDMPGDFFVVRRRCKPPSKPRRDILRCTIDALMMIEILPSKNRVGPAGSTSAKKERRERDRLYNTGERLTGFSRSVVGRFFLSLAAVVVRGCPAAKKKKPRER